LYEVSDTEIIQSNTIEKVFGLLGLFFRGVALEENGRKEDACEQYQIVNDFLFRYRLPQFSMTRAARDFLCASLYRGALLLQQMGHPIDSACLYRSFLAFHQVTLQKKQPNNAIIRLIRAISSYCDLLDRHFRRTNYKNLCDDGQAQVSGRDLAQIWQPETVREDLILCSMLLKTIEKPDLVVRELENLDLEAHLIRRFARIGYLEGIIRFQKTLFQSSVSNATLYRTLFLSLFASGRYEQAVLAAKMYTSGHGHDVFTLMTIAQLYLMLPSKHMEAFHILDTRLDCESMEVSMQVPYFLLRSQFLLLSHRLTQARQELQLVLQIDETSPKAHFLLAKCAAEEGKLGEAETFVKKSLSVDSSCIEAWCLFALLKSAKRDFEGCLTVCNSELSNQIQRDIK
jgi:tetratricopeptide (TPR) repeat protein